MISDPLAVFLRDFAEATPLTFSWAGGSVTCDAIFDNSFVDAAIGETALDTTAPRLTCLHSDVAAIPREAVVTVRGKAYSVTQIQPDGTGFATVTLAHEEE